MKRRRGILIIALLIAAVTNGCTALAPRQERTHFLLLAPAASGPASGAKVRSLTIGLGPVQFPQYLDRQELVIRTSPNGFNLSERDRWAEPLAENFRNVLAADLRSQLANVNIVPYPWYPGTGMDYVVRVQVERFDTDSTNAAELIARWELMNPKSRQVLVGREVQFRQPASSDGGEAIAAALSSELAQLGQQVASAIVQVEQERVARGES
jgi:uncharacterized protein